MKRFISLILILALSFSAAACSPAKDTKAEAKSFNIIKKIESFFTGNSKNSKDSKNSKKSGKNNLKAAEEAYPATPGVVTGMSVKVNTSNKESSTQTVEWDEVKNADYYMLDIATPYFVDIATTSTVKVDSNVYLSEGLEPLTLYAYRARAVTTSPTGTAVFGETSVPIVKYTAPLQPEAPEKERVGNTEAVIKWTAAEPVTGATIQYNVYRSTDGNSYDLYAPNLTDTAFADIYLQPDTEYYYKIQTIGIIGDEILESSQSEPLMIKTTNNISPDAVTGLSVIQVSKDSLTFSWEEKPDTSEYRVYRLDPETNTYARICTTAGLSFTDKDLTPGTNYSYKVTALSIDGTAESPMSMELNVATLPAAPINVAAKTTTSSAVLTWEPASNATGYIVYRYNSDTKYYDVIGTTSETTFTDTPLSPGVNVIYKVQAYLNTTDYASELSDAVKTSTLPLAPTLKIKVGAKKVRLSWTQSKNCDGYIVYSKTPSTEYKQVYKNSSASTLTKVISSLTNNTKYSFKIVSYRTAFDQKFVSPYSTVISGTPKKITTSTAPKLYKTKKATINSSSWSKIKKLAVYNKSLVIPGLTCTNVLGFKSTSMCPQGMCVAGSYLLIAAYDQAKEEKSVIYVMDISTRKLKTVIVLQNKTHCGGLCYDGEEVWITNGTKVSSLSFSQIKAAAKAGSTYKKLSYTSTLSVGMTASFVAYYKQILWVGSYNASKSTSIYSFHIGLDEDKKNMLSKQHVGTLPSRVQGIKFASGGRLIASRAYAYTHELAIYKPKITSKKITLGSRIKTVTMPFLSQDIDIKGNYLYVNFESAAGANSQSPDYMDRVVALKLKKTLKVTKKKKSNKK
ncbi:MAG: fibronectin type III domain-containing protein [Lachnospiraceae bacterium]|nr:fibronectin type III domain-containing protein [Lachnospiraceae bacterium]